MSSNTLIPNLNNVYTQAALFSWTKDKLDIYVYWRMEETFDRYKLKKNAKMGLKKADMINREELL